MSEMWIRCDSEEQYAKWMAACRLAAKGRSLADSSYEAEVKNITGFLRMQHPAPAPVISPSALSLVPEDYIAPRFLKKFKGKVRIPTTLTILKITPSSSLYKGFWKPMPTSKN